MSQALPRKPKTWHLTDLVEHFRYCAETFPLLIHDGPVVFERAARDIDVGLRPAGDGRSQKRSDDGTNNGGTPRIAIARTTKMDPVSFTLRRLLSDAREVAERTERMVHDTAFLMGLSMDEARLLVEQRKPGRGAECANLNCKRWVENTISDPLRGGRCDACRKYRDRHDGAERPAEKIEEATYKESA